MRLPIRYNYKTYIEILCMSSTYVKTEKTEYLSNQLTYAHFDQKFIFPIKFGTSEQIFIFLISKMSQISGTATVKWHTLDECLYEYDVLNLTNVAWQTYLLF